MVKVVYASLKPANAKAKAATVQTKRVKSREGKVVTIHTVNADSRTFGEDLSYVFRQNVKKARRENKRRTGLSDRVPAKD